MKFGKRENPQKSKKRKIPSVFTKSTTLAHRDSNMGPRFLKMCSSKNSTYL